MTICPLIYFTFFSSADRWLNAPLSRQEVALSNTAHSSSVSPPQFLSHRGASQHDDGWCSFHLLVCVFWGQMSRQQPTTPQSSASAPFKHTREKKHEELLTSHAWNRLCQQLLQKSSLCKLAWFDDTEQKVATGNKPKKLQKTFEAKTDFDYWHKLKKTNKQLRLWWSEGDAERLTAEVDWTTLMFHIH